MNGVWQKNKWYPFNRKWYRKRLHCKISFKNSHNATKQPNNGPEILAHINGDIVPRIPNRKMKIVTYIPKNIYFNKFFNKLGMVLLGINEIR